MGGSEIIQARIDLLRAALRLAAHDYDEADDPGWQADLDQEIFDKAANEYANALRAESEEQTN